MIDRDFQIGEWRVEPRRGIISGPQGRRRLEPRVMDVLAYLARRNGDPASQEEIVRAVWGEVALSEGALFRYISQLRSALGDDARRPCFIETIPKRGYRLLLPVEFRASSMDFPRTAPKGGRWRAVRVAGLTAFAGLTLATVLWTQQPGKELTPGPASADGRRTSPKEASKAYKAMRLGDLFEDRVDCGAYQKGRRAFEQAADQFPEARYELIQVHLAAAVMGCWPAEASYSQVEELVGRGNLELGRRESALGALALFRDRDPDRARRLLGQAARLAPELRSQEVLFAAMEAVDGNLEQALESARRVADQGVTDAGEHWAVGVLLYFNRRFEEAARQFSSMEEMFPGFPPARAFLALSLVHNRQYAAAVKAADEIPEARGPASRFAVIPGYVYAAAGERERAVRFLQRWESRARSQWVSPCAMALLYTGLGRYDKAQEWLQKARQENDPWLVFVPFDPSFASLPTLHPIGAREKGH